MNNWITPTADQLPPDPTGNWFSPHVWLLLSNGDVVMGQCLHRPKNAVYKALVHDWFVVPLNGEPSMSLGVYSPNERVSVTGWQPIVPPKAPMAEPEYPDATGWAGPGHARLGEFCPACPTYLDPRPKLIEVPQPGGFSRLHCEQCNAGSYGLHYPRVSEATA